MLSLTTTPILSQSGSVPKIISGDSCFAISNANSNTCGISGFGYGAVGKFPLGSSCSLTTFTFEYPSSDNTLLTGIFPLPWIGVYIIFKSFAFSLTNSFLIVKFLTSSIYALSTSSPIYTSKSLFKASSSDIFLIIEKSLTSFTNEIILLAFSSVTCPPNSS